MVATYGPATASPTRAIPIPSAYDTPDADTIELTCPHPGRTASPNLATPEPSAYVEPLPDIITPLPVHGDFGCPNGHVPNVVSPILAMAGIYLPCPLYFLKFRRLLLFLGRH